MVGPLEQRGASVRLLGNRNLSANSDDISDCEPTFTLKCEESPFIPGIDPTSAGGILQTNDRRSELFCADLRSFADNHAISSEDVLLINSLRHWSLGDVVDWMQSLRPDRRPIVILVLHYTPFPQPGLSDPTEGAYRDAFGKIANCEARDRLLLCTDSERLATEYRSLYDINIHLLPIPHCPEAIERRAVGRPLSIGFAGEARFDKGFQLLPSMVSKLREAKPDHPLSFIFQSYNGEGEAPVQFPPDNGIQLLSSPLTNKEYESFIASIDLMLIPYLGGPYRSQTSGVFCEAVALGLPVVVPANTWMADQLAVSGAGLTFEAGDADDLTRACVDAIDGFADLRLSARRSAAQWRAVHNAENYCAIVLKLIAELEMNQIIV